MKTRVRQMCVTIAAVMALAIGASLPADAAELLMFESPGCVWCLRWHQEVGPGYAKSAEGQRAPLRRVQQSEAGRAGVVLATPVTGTPTFVLADDGREVGRITGYPGADFFWGLLERLLEKLPVEEQKIAPEQRADAARPAS